MQHNIIYNIDSMVESMKKDFPRDDNTRGRPKTQYKTIAEKWAMEIPRVILEVSWVEKDTGKRFLEINKLRKKFDYQYRDENQKRGRWFDWFCEQYPLYKVIQKGYKMKDKKGVSTEIELCYDSIERLEANPEYGVDHDSLVELLQENHRDDIQNGIVRIIDQEYSINGLNNFIEQTREEIPYSTGKYRLRLERNLETAYRIRASTDVLSIEKSHQAVEKNQVDCLTGTFPVAVKQSIFGREYHTGLNLQNAHKFLRNALLGGTTNIDIEASVFCFYEYLGREFGLRIPDALGKMVDSKKRFREKLGNEIFDSEKTNREWRDKNIKKILVAIGFGATTHEYGCISDLYRKSPHVRQRIRTHPDIVALQKFVLDLIAATKNEEKQNTRLRKFIQDMLDRTGHDRRNYRRVLAFLYQQHELEMREAMIQCIEADHHGRVVLQTHDGIHVADVKDRLDIPVNMQYRLDKMMPNTRLSITRLDHFKKKTSRDEKHEIAEHHKRIAEEENLARGFHGRFSEKSRIVIQKTPEEMLKDFLQQDKEQMEWKFNT